MEALRKFLADSGMSQTEFAEAIGVTPGRVWQLLNGTDGIPRADTIARIEKITRGKVKLSDWVKDDEAA